MRVTQRAGQWLITDRQQRLSQPPENVDLGATPKPNRGDLRPQKGLGWERGECRGCPLQSWDVTGFQQLETVAQSCSGCAVCVNGPCMEAPARGPGGARCGEPARTGGPAASGRFFRLLQKGTHSRREVAGGRWTPDSESSLLWGGETGCGTGVAKRFPGGDMKGPGEKALWCRPRQEGSGACWAHRHRGARPRGGPSLWRSTAK